MSTTTDLSSTVFSSDFADRIEANIKDFYDVLQQSMSFRLEPWDHFDTSRARAEGMAEQMIQAANVATDVEEKLTMVMILQQHVEMIWDREEAKLVNTLARQPSSQFISSKGKLHPLMAAEPELYETRNRLRSAVEAGKRAVDRLAALHAVASRAAGIAFGS